MDISKTEQAKISPSKGLLNPAMPRKRLPSTRSKAKSSRRARTHHPRVELRARSVVNSKGAALPWTARSLLPLSSQGSLLPGTHPLPLIISIPPRNDDFQPTPSPQKTKHGPQNQQKAQPYLRLVPAFQLRRRRNASNVFWLNRVEEHRVRLHTDSSIHQSTPDTTSEIFLTGTFQVGNINPH